MNPFDKQPHHNHRQTSGEHGSKDLISLNEEALNSFCWWRKKTTREKRTFFL
jgi:hypothetical protein